MDKDARLTVLQSDGTYALINFDDKMKAMAECIRKLGQIEDLVDRLGFNLSELVEEQPKNEFSMSLNKFAHMMQFDYAIQWTKRFDRHELLRLIKSAINGYMTLTDHLKGSIEQIDKYWVAPMKIDVNKWTCGHFICSNCGKSDFSITDYVIYLNRTDHISAKGNVCKNLHPKRTSFALCENCFNELLQSMLQASGGRKQLAPTEKQLSFIKAICDILGIKDPKVTTRDDASKFISTNIKAYNEEMESLYQSDWALLNGYD